MIPLFLTDIVDIVSKVNTMSTNLVERHPDALVPITQETRDEILPVFKKIEATCQKYDLKSAADRAAFIAADLADKPEITREYLTHEFSVFGQSIGIETQKMFLYVPESDASFYDQEKLFGQEVYDKFPGARDEIRHAGTALACELFTACVFHLMRAAEFGLRVLAHDRRVKLSLKRPLELAMWGEIIDGIESKVGEQEQRLHRSVGKNEFSEFYRGAIGELRAFKAVWRDPSAHARKSYDSFEARSAMLHVSRFMQRISCKLSEQNKKPVRWKKSGGNLSCGHKVPCLLLGKRPGTAALAQFNHTENAAGGNGDIAGALVGFFALTVLDGGQSVCILGHLEAANQPTCR